MALGARGEDVLAVVGFVDAQVSAQGACSGWAPLQRHGHFGRAAVEIALRVDDPDGTASIGSSGFASLTGSPSCLTNRTSTVRPSPETDAGDLRAYYAKHPENDRLDSQLLVRLPLLHPDGLHRHTSDGPAEPLHRAVQMRSLIVKRRTAVFQRLDALLELLGPSWYDALGSNYGKAALAVLTRYADPSALLRLGQARLTRFLIRFSCGAWREDHARLLLTAAREPVQLGGDRIGFAALAADIAVEPSRPRS